MAEPIAIADWEAVGSAFREFFGGAGKVVETPDRLSFSAEQPATGFVVNRSGVLTASMPLHGVEGVVDRITFDRDADEVRLRGPAVGYTYRVPPGLRTA